MMTVLYHDVMFAHTHLLPIDDTLLLSVRIDIT
jgi:hypothetical protein